MIASGAPHLSADVARCFSDLRDETLARVRRARDVAALRFFVSDELPLLVTGRVAHLVEERCDALAASGRARLAGAPPEVLEDYEELDLCSVLGRETWVDFGPGVVPPWLPTQALAAVGAILTVLAGALFFALGPSLSSLVVVCVISVALLLSYLIALPRANAAYAGHLEDLALRYLDEVEPQVSAMLDDAELHFESELALFCRANGVDRGHLH